MRRPRRIKPSDKRSPLLRLLQDGLDNSGMVCVQYHEQFRTLWAAQKDGLIDDRQMITDAGRTWLNLAAELYAMDKEAR